MKKILEFISSSISLIVPKNKKLVLFGGSNRNFYNESTRYLFEYLNKHNDKGHYVWMTNSKKVLNHLKKNNLPAMYYLSINGIWAYLRAAIVVCNGTTPLGLSKFVGKDTIKITLNHGCGPRSTIGYDPSIVQSKKDLANLFNTFDYYNFSSKFACKMIGEQQYRLPQDKIINFGFPRCDYFFDKKKTSNLKKFKPYLKANYNKINDSSKCILYAPTWRPSHHPKPDIMPLNLMKGFNLNDFNQWLISKDIIFFISGHDLSEGFYNTKNISNIITLQKDDLFDINLILPEFDLLLTDYSSIATDYMLLKREVIYYLPDYDFFLNKYGLLEDFKKELPGPEVTDYKSLKQVISEYVYKDSFRENLLENYLKKYYDLSNSNSCREISKFINDLIK